MASSTSFVSSVIRRASTSLVDVRRLKRTTLVEPATTKELKMNPWRPPPLPSPPPFTELPCPPQTLSKERKGQCQQNLTHRPLQPRFSTPLYRATSSLLPNRPSPRSSLSVQISQSLSLPIFLSPKISQLVGLLGIAEYGQSDIHSLQIFFFQ